MIKTYQIKPAAGKIKDNQERTALKAKLQLLQMLTDLLSLAFIALLFWCLNG